MRIGYQGVANSWSEYAAKLLSKKVFSDTHTDIELVGYINSSDTLNALYNGDVPYVVVALYNNIGGIVQETTDALKDCQYKIMESISIPVKHSIIQLVGNKKVYDIIGHIQALRQCTKHLEKYPFANLNTVPDGVDFARSGEMLDGDLVIVPSIYKPAEGEEFVSQEIQNDGPCLTTFLLLSKP